MPDSDGFFARQGGFDAGILTDFKSNQRSPGGKDAPRRRPDGFQTDSRGCLPIPGVTDRGRFFRQARRFGAGILTDFKPKQRGMAEKDAAGPRFGSLKTPSSAGQRKRVRRLGALTFFKQGPILPHRKFLTYNGGKGKEHLHHILGRGKRRGRLTAVRIRRAQPRHSLP